MGPRLRRVFSDVLVVFTGPRLIAIVFLCIGGVSVLVSILDADVSLSDREVVMLSTTTEGVSSEPLAVENPSEGDEEVDSKS